MHDSMRMDTNTATDPDTDTFVLIKLCIDLCRTVRVKGLACPLFSSLPVTFSAVLFPAGGQKKRDNF